MRCHVHPNDHTMRGCGCSPGLELTRFLTCMLTRAPTAHPVRSHVSFQSSAAWYTWVIARVYVVIHWYTIMNDGHPRGHIGTCFTSICTYMWICGGIYVASCLSNDRWQDWMLGDIVNMEKVSYRFVFIYLQNYIYLCIPLKLSILVFALEIMILTLTC